MTEIAPIFAPLLEQFSIRAGAFIVTIYGDVVAPRGGQLWMGNIIDTCAQIGISESRVRTAVSRLVAAEQISGDRLGRKSYYRLTPAAAKTYSEAARLIYRSPGLAPLREWRFVILPQGGTRETIQAQLLRLRFGFPRTHLAIFPDRGQQFPDIAAEQFGAQSYSDLSQLVLDGWPLAELNERAQAFIAAFSRLLHAVPKPVEALGLRLLLVHNFREFVLRDPEVPEEFAPKNWQVPAARRLFAALYLHLSPAADQAISAGFVDAHGALHADPTRLARRIADLSRA